MPGPSVRTARSATASVCQGRVIAEGKLHMPHGAAGISDHLADGVSLVDGADDANEGSGHSRSPGLRRRCAARARSAAVDAAYRPTIARELHPASRIRSVSSPPLANHVWANQ